MSEKCPEYTSTSEATAIWRNKLSKFNTIGYFGRRPCSIAKGVFATKAIRNVTLTPDKAKINAYFNGENIDFDIKIDDNGEVETSIDKKKITSQIVTIAAIMAINVIVTAPEPCAEDINSERVDDFSNSEDSDVSDDYGNGRHSKSKKEKNVLVKFCVVGNEVVMKSYLDNDIRRPIFMQNSDVVNAISGNAKRMSLLRLLYYARKSKFEFYMPKRDYRLENLRDAVDLMQNNLNIWEKFFFVELSQDMLLLKRGVIFPEVCAKVRETDREHIVISWDISTKYGKIPSENMQSLLRANGRAIFVADIGAVALTTNQISTIRHVFCDNPMCETHKYMLYVLLNQNYISVDTSGCKITHIDVGTYRFSLPGFLKDYQKNGIYAMRAILDAGCHCLLADEMGLGKTLQVLALICSSDSSTKSLVVCPASVVFVWQREIEKFFPEKKSVAVDRNTDFDQDVDFFICSYAFVHKLNQRLREIQFDYMVVDEAQYIKNPRSKTTVSCCNIDSRYRIAITGTPIENNLFDIWSIFRFLMPGFFCGYNQFQDSINYPEFRENFKKQVSTFTIRRTKKSVAIELPKRNELEIFCQMSDAQRIAYENIRVELKKSMSKTSGDNNMSSMNVLTAIMRLRQAACAQFILPETLRHDHSMNSPKIESLMIKLQNIAADGRKVVIFSQFLEMLDEISIRIKKEIPEMSVSMLTGKSRNREALVEEFQSTKNSAAMLISLKAGGVGITLHSAEYAFLMEPWWNPAVEEQAIARIHRIGQKNITTIYRMITENSIEERMRKIQSSKKDLFNEFIRTGVDNIAMTNFYLKNLESLIG